MYNTRDNSSNRQNSPSHGQDVSSSKLSEARPTKSNAIEIPQISLPKGGGAIKGIDEKFQVNAANGTISFGVPLPVAGGRGFAPQLGLSYNSGAGNSPFGFGWGMGLPSISRKTDKKLPLYQDAIEGKGVDSDTFILSGAEDLVPFLVLSNGNWVPKTVERTIAGEGDYWVKYYRPRIEGSFARIELWRHKTTGNTYWRTITPDNITSIYGKSPAARIADPADSTKIYEWLIERSYDDKGHLMEFEYKAENSQRIPLSQVHTKNRVSGGTLTYANKYIKRVRYGNRDTFTALRSRQGGYTGDFLFETVFDYGEFDWDEPWRGEVNEWNYRDDPFSMYRAGFEVRTTRLCKRVLLFLHIPDDGARKGYEGLVSSLELTHGKNTNLPDQKSTWTEQENTFDAKQPDIFTFLTGLTSKGYLKHEDGGYTHKAMPPALFRYQPHTWNLEINQIESDSLVHAPVGVDDINYALIDFYSEGIAGILTEQQGALFYKENLGNAQFADAKLLSPKPSFAGISTGTMQITDLDGNGMKQMTIYGKGIGGFFELTPEEQWQPFQAFEQVPNIDFADPNMRMIDLDGDGKPDLMLTEHDAFVWYRADGKKGYETSARVAAQYDEEKGPVLVFADQTLSVFLADMSGDGLTDLVRIRNGEICYWPNLGYGRFGAKISMDQAPVFDAPDQYHPQYLRLADIDGSGITDILYLGQGKCRCWFNLSGNGWPETPIEIPLPHIDNLTQVTVADLMGNGTACLLWSSPLPSDSGTPMRYIDLMSGKKPHLLHHYENNMGKEVNFEFKSSTHYYLEDKKAGTPWVTKLPFPVHCLEKVVVRDLIRDTVFANAYRYHHGYFDYEEREFRGFGRVEQLDTETFNLFSRRNGQNVVTEEHHQPPVRTVTWFHTGALIEGKKMLDQYEQEYFKNTAVQEHDLPDPVAPVDVNTDEYREALRAFKGMALRQEVYADDDSDKANIPCSTNRATYQIRMVQPKADNEHASFQVFGGETVSYGYDRNPADPRISHSIVLDSNELGQPLVSSSIVYPRIARPMGANTIPDVVWDEQNKGHIVVSTARYTNDIDNLTLLPNDYRLRTAYESKSYELLGQTISASQYWVRENLLAEFNAAVEIPFEQDGDGSKQKRLSGYTRAYFLKNDLSDPTIPANRLPLGQMESLGIGYRSLQMAFTPGLVTRHYGARVTDAMLTAAKYEHSEGDLNWWIPSGTAIYPPDAATQFYLPIGSRDIMGTESRVEYDAFKLTVLSATDAKGNTISAENDYRTLSPVLVTDPNGNRSAVATDELGMVVRSAIMGKAGAGEGDTLADPTARMEYDLFNWVNNRKPNFAHTFAREQHGATNPRWQESYVYSDGSGGVIMAKAQAERGPALRWNDATQTLETIGDENSPRWIGNGRTILNNKGNPIRQYEPYFSTTHEYEADAALVEIGISPVLYYDPIGRNYRTDFPNGTFAKAEFDPWHSIAYDTNDTVRDSQWYVDRGSPDPTGAEPADPERRAAWLAAKHHDTPSVAHTDSLGRTVYAIADYGGGKTTAVRSETDLLGRYSRVFDQKDRQVATGYINMVGMSMYGESAEKGERWIFQDALGRLVRIWDNNQREFYTTYDILHRPVAAFVREGGTDTLFNYTVYGDELPDATARSLNLKGIPFRVYDTAGMLDLRRLDFKGNPLEIERRLVRDYKNTIDWSALAGAGNVAAIAAAAEPLLETEIFTAASTYDALSRPIQTILPDNTVVRPTYNEGNGLDKLEAQLRGTGAFRTFLEKQDYNAKGQRQYAEYGNGLVTRYFYDPKTFRLTNLLTERKGNNPDPVANTTALQNLKYNFDPVGNITQIRDDAQQTHYYRNAVVSPMQTFEYDAIYQLIRATGREHAGLNPAQPAHGDIPVLAPVPHTNDANAVRIYTQTYDYDDLGNITQMRHITSGGVGNWTRLYRYAFDANPTDRTNRLIGTNRPNEQDGSINDTQYLYDLHGNMTRMPHLQAMDWNYLDQLRHVDLGGGGDAWYVYPGGGQRIRKVIERNGGKRIERIYLGAVEVYRERQGNNPAHVERWTTHISDNTGRIAQVDTKTRDTNNEDRNNPLNTPLIRYQYANHLGSAVLETDEVGAVISYEEYHPYGTSAYRIAKSAEDLSLKRYRFSGKERDDETGLYYFGARYYAAWLGRWTSSDPAGFVDGFCLFRYCKGNPIIFHDPSGMQTEWIVPRSVDTIGEFNAWATRAGIRYTGTPSYDSNTHVWSVESWERVAGGEGGAASPEPPAPSPPESPPPSSSGGGIALSGGGASTNSDSIPTRQQIQPGTPPTTGIPDRGIPQVDLPQAPPGTDFEGAESTARDTYRRNNPMAPGEQVQHWFKWREGRRTNLDPRITNDQRNLSPLQSLNRLSNRIYNFAGRTFRNPHTYADRGLIPAIQRFYNRTIGGFTTERVRHVMAGRGARYLMEGRMGPRPPYMNIGAMVGGVAGTAYLGMARNFVPLFAEAEIGIQAVGMYATANGIGAGTIVGEVAATAAAAPAAVAGTALAAGVAGYVVGGTIGHAVERATESKTAGVLAGTASGAAVGAVVGAAVGVWFFGIGAAPAAAIGAVVGGIGGFIGSYW